MTRPELPDPTSPHAADLMTIARLRLDALVDDIAAASDILGPECSLRLGVALQKVDELLHVQVAEVAG